MTHSVIDSWQGHSTLGRQNMAQKEQFHAEFEERGYLFKSWISYEEHPHFVIRVWRKDTNELVKDVQLPPMNFEPRWGVDVSDLEELEAKTEEILKELP
jgi:hypothetical protein